MADAMISFLFHSQQQLPKFLSENLKLQISTVIVNPRHIKKHLWPRYTKHFINDLLPAKKGDIEGRTAQAMARNLYIDVKKSFVSKINRERQEAGTNDIAKVAAQTPPDSAVNILRRFRQDEFNAMIGWPQNLGDIRRVDLEKVVLNPSDEYLRFLTEWYNSIV